MDLDPGRVVFVGDVGVGKTTIISKYKKTIDSTVVTSPIKSTVAVEHSQLTVQVGGVPVSLSVSDTAGLEHYRSLIPMYARRAHVGVVVFDFAVPNTFDNVVGWIQYLRDNSSLRLIVIVGNKMDLEPGVSEKQASDIALKEGGRFFKSSAVTGDGLTEIFETIAEFVLNDPIRVNAKKEHFQLRNTKGECC